MVADQKCIKSSTKITIFSEQNACQRMHYCASKSIAKHSQNTHKTLTIIADKRWTKHRQISVFSWPEIGWAKVIFCIGAFLIINGGTNFPGIYPQASGGCWRGDCGEHNPNPATKRKTESRHKDSSQIILFGFGVIPCHLFINGCVDVCGHR